MSLDTVLKIVIVAAASIGCYAAQYIRKHKKSGEKMICPLDSDCEAVVHSNYSKILGVPLEYLGIIYYCIVIGTYGLSVFFYGNALKTLTVYILWITVAAFVFSIYLTSLQLFKIKEWCFWCLISALMCLIIFTGAILIGNNLPV